MALRIMENKRIPRKIKKALKYAFLHPRVCGRLIRYGAVYTIGRNSKWTRKAAKNKTAKGLCRNDTQYNRTTKGYLCN